MLNFPSPLPRMVGWALASLLLMVAALTVQTKLPGSVVAVTLYKLHLLMLGGWGGYWLDRGLFPYDRPHIYLDDADETSLELAADDELLIGSVGQLATNAFHSAMLRRAVVVAACLVCVGLGA